MNINYIVWAATRIQNSIWSNEKAMYVSYIQDQEKGLNISASLAENWLMVDFYRLLCFCCTKWYCKSLQPVAVFLLEQSCSTLGALVCYWPHTSSQNPHAPGDVGCWVGKVFGEAWGRCLTMVQYPSVSPLPFICLLLLHIPPSAPQHCLADPPGSCHLASLFTVANAVGAESLLFIFVIYLSRVSWNKRFGDLAYISMKVIQPTSLLNIFYLTDKCGLFFQVCFFETGLHPISQAGLELTV